ncbi:winged helix-turn-helix domain-containing protein [Roseateles sp. BYS87W]
MPPDAAAAVLAVARANGWAVQRDERTTPAVRAGDVVVATAACWAAVCVAAEAPAPRGLLLLDACSGATAAAADAVRLAWPGEADLLASRLAQLMAAPALRLDAVSRTVRYRGQDVHLTPKECRILQALLDRTGQAVSRETLEAAVHAWGQEFESNTLDVHVHRLRRKLPDAGICAVRGFGYALRPRR